MFGGRRIALSLNARVSTNRVKRRLAICVNTNSPGSNTEVVLFTAFSKSERGTVLVTFALWSTLALGLTLGVVNLASASSQTARVQDALDSSALYSAMLLNDPLMTDDQVQSATRIWIAANAPNTPGIENASIAIDRVRKEVTLNYSELASNMTASTIWNGLVKINVISKAGLGGASTYPVCILITEPYDSHTLRASNNSKMDLNHCVVQVNTANWDAVEAKGSSYIHINDGQNCYVGDIHFGDVKPAKMPTCALLPDPFINLTVAASACDHFKFEITKKNPASGPLRPGTYCGGINIEQSATFTPGLYIIKDDGLTISGSKTDIQAEGATFVFTGSHAGLDIDSQGTMAFSPAPASAAGIFDGFVFFLDNGAASSPAAVSSIKNATIKMSGSLYFAGQTLVIDTGSKVEINPGSIVAGALLGDGGDLDFTGLQDPKTAAEKGLRKPVGNSIPVLLK